MCTTCLDSSIQRHLHTRCIENHIRADTTCDFMHSFRNIINAWIQHICCPVVCCELLSTLHHLRNDDVFRALDFEHLHNTDADRTAADNQDVVIAFEGGYVDSVPRYSEWLNQCCGFEGDFVWDWVEVVGWGGCMFGHPAAVACYRTVRVRIGSSIPEIALSSPDNPINPIFSQQYSYPIRQVMHVPSKIVGRTTTRWPGETFVTSSPTSSTIPPNSWPKVTGHFDPVIRCGFWGIRTGPPVYS